MFSVSWFCRDSQLHENEKVSCCSCDKGGDEGSVDAEKPICKNTGEVFELCDVES